MGIIQVLIAFALFGILAAYIADISSLSSKEMARMNSQMGRSQIEQMVLSSALSKTTCQSSIVKESFNFSVPPPPDSGIVGNTARIKFRIDPSSADVVADGADMKAFGVTVDFLRLTGVTNVTPPVPPPGWPVGNRLYSGTLVMKVIPKGQSTIKLKARPVAILFVETNSSGNIVSCYGYNSDEAVCSGNQFRVAVGTGPSTRWQCKSAGDLLYDTCGPNKVVKTGSSGGVVCADASGQYTVNNSACAMPNGTMTNEAMCMTEACPTSVQTVPTWVASTMGPPVVVQSPTTYKNCSGSCSLSAPTYCPNIISP